MAVSPEEPERRAGWTRRGAAVLASLAAAGSCVAVVVTLAAPSGSSVGRAPTPSPRASALHEPGARDSSTTVSAKPAAPAGSQVEPERPDVVQFPSGATVAVRSASTRPDGSLAVPSDIRAAGWWDGGARVGDPFGSILIAGHVDSAVQGLGPFAELLTVSVEDRVVLESSRLRQDFEIDSLELVPNDSLADRPDLFSAQGSARLVLVTCAGPFVPSAGGYQNLAVVTATPVGRPAPR